MRYFIIYAIVTLTASFAVCVSADEFTSSSFRVLDPVIYPAGYGTSSDYQLWSSLAQLGIGTSTATGFSVHGGFLPFPTVSTPVVTATAGNGQVALSWTAVTGALGWTVSGYNVGQSTTAGGTYIYTSVGNVTSSTRTGLTNGTTYYFVVRPEDAFGNAIATSSEVSGAPAAPASTPAPTPVPASGGGSSGTPSGGGGGPSGPYVAPSVSTEVNFSGRAYPKSTVTLLKDAQVTATTVADPNANFSIKLSSISAGNYIFSVYSEDREGRRSSLLTFPVGVTAGTVTNIGGIFIAPTIAVDKSEVARGDNIAIFGQSVPAGDITISVNSEEEFFGKVKADKDGIYLLNFDTTPLTLDQHFTKSKAATANEISSFGPAVSFRVGKKNVRAVPPVKCPAKADLNSDCKVNLVDFSIAAYWYKRVLSVEFKKIEKDKLNGDEKITLVDFSIMAYYWTG